MYKHPISAFFRMLPAVSWLAACVVALWTSLRLYLYLRAEGRWSDLTKAWPDALMLLGFVAVAIYSVRMAHKEYKEALQALRADTPIRLAPPKRLRPQLSTTTRYPLSDNLRAELHEVIETLQSAGMLDPDEITTDELIDRAEILDEWPEVDLYMAMKVLHAIRSERERPFANITFFLTDAETDESDAVNIVQELVRLCGRSQELSAVRIRSVSEEKIVPAHAGFPPPNAVADFELANEHHAVPFVLYSKNLPGGLIEALARILTRADDPQRFVWDNFDSFLSVSYLTLAQTSLVNSAEREKFPRFEEVA